MVNFNIVAGDNSFYEKADEFMELYTNPDFNVKQIMEKLDLTTNQYKHLRKYCIDFKGLHPKRRRCRTHKSKFINPVLLSYSLWF